MSDTESEMLGEVEGGGVPLPERLAEANLRLEKTMTSLASSSHDILYISNTLDRLDHENRELQADIDKMITKNEVYAAGIDHFAEDAENWYEAPEFEAMASRLSTLSRAKEKHARHNTEARNLRAKARRLKRENDELKKENAAQGKMMVKLGGRLVRLKRKYLDEHGELEAFRNEEASNNPFFTTIS